MCGHGERAGFIIFDGFAPAPAATTVLDQRKDWETKGETIQIVNPPPPNSTRNHIESK